MAVQVHQCIQKLGKREAAGSISTTFGSKAVLHMDQISQFLCTEKMFYKYVCCNIMCCNYKLQNRIKNWLKIYYLLTSIVNNWPSLTPNFILRQKVKSSFEAELYMAYNKFSSLGFGFNKPNWRKYVNFLASTLICCNFFLLWPIQAKFYWDFKSKTLFQKKLISSPYTQ